MITHSIVRYQSGQFPGKPRMRPGTHEHRCMIFENTLQKTLKDENYLEGTMVKVKGHRGLGTIVMIEKDIARVKWDGLKVSFIEVYCPGINEIILCHPSDLKGT